MSAQPAILAESAFPRELEVSSILAMALDELEAFNDCPEHLQSVMLSKAIDLVVVRETRGIVVGARKHTRDRNPNWSAS